MEYKRTLNLDKILKKKSHFLFGARSTGKTTLIEAQLPKSTTFDLLDDNVFQRLLRDPKFIGESIHDPESIIVIDEVQRLPKVLNEVQRLMRKIPNRFLLTGSSARKLKKGSANLLGGRAWERHLHPLTYREIDDFELIKYLNVGGLPHVYLSQHPEEELKHYVSLYLREEVLNESLTRNIEYFVRFLDILALSNGEELYFEGLSNDSGVPARTIQNYVEILQDTLVALVLHPFIKTAKRKAIQRSKFYFFDLGVTNHLAKRGQIAEKSDLYGRAFEHFIVREISTYASYSPKDHQLFYWRSKSQFEVDLILDDQWAIEIKATDNVSNKHLKGLKALKEEGLIKNYCVLSNDPVKRVVDDIAIYPWKEFLDKLFRDYFKLD